MNMSLKGLCRAFINFISRKIRFLKYHIFLYFPLFFYFGSRSYIAQDEGYYALQSRWILDSGNWLAPMWWSEPVFDRTIGLQWLIASFQSVLGNSIFVSHLPSLISGIITLIATYKISQNLLGKDLSWISPFALSMSFLWINNLHLATQDMPLLALELVGVYSFLKTSSSKDNIWKFLSGIWIGLAFMLKTFMVLLPLLSIAPYLYLYSRKALRSKYFYLGIVIGFLPFIIWLILSINLYGFLEVSNLYTKLQHLSSTDLYSKSPLYYLWNLPLKTFPWSILAIIGSIFSFKYFSLKTNMIVLYYPLILLTLLSIFNTKTPYYALQLTPYIALQSTIALKYLVQNRSNIVAFLSWIVSILGLIFTSLSLLNLKYKFLPLAFSGDINIASALLLLLGLFWALSIFTKSAKSFFGFFIIGLYLSFVILVQSGLLSDRIPDFRIAYSNIVFPEKFHEEEVDFVFPKGNLTSHSFSQVVSLALPTKRLGHRLDETELLIKGQYAWIDNSRIPELHSKTYKVITKSPIFRPWSLIYLVEE